MLTALGVKRWPRSAYQLPFGPRPAPRSLAGYLENQVAAAYPASSRWTTRGCGPGAPGRRGPALRATTRLGGLWRFPDDLWPGRVGAPSASP
jgi:hypothetical protein